jgi:poly(A) polymerase
VAQLRAFNMYETVEETQRREMVLGRLQRIVKAFIIQAGTEKGLSESMARETGGRIVTFGSFRLGVHSPGADVDILCVAPRHVSREDFFRIMPILLAREGGGKSITDLNTVPDTAVPVITMKFEVFWTGCSNHGCWLD